MQSSLALRRTPGYLVLMSGLLISLVAAILALSAPAARAATPLKAGGTTTATTASGLRLTVTPVRRLNPNGATVKVTGTGYDMTVGIYVALCVKPKKGQVPSPCVGGINTSGKGAASMWVSSNPPPYGQKLAVPFKKGGSFSVKLRLKAKVGSIDCHVVQCAIVTRADHLNSDNRNLDVVIPVRFAP
jgi:hypothetical protein